jgi:hypothetical protein
VKERRVAVMVESQVMEPQPGSAGAERSKLSDKVE